MADAGQQSGDLSRSVVAGSEFVYDFFCHVCQEDGRHLEAEGYCQDCMDYLCKTCFDNHCRPRPSRHHILLSKQDMPKGKAFRAQSYIEKDKSTAKCHLHPDEYIQYYCQDDDTLGCSVCATMNHRNCTGLQYLPDVAGEICDSEEMKDLLKDLSSIKNRTTAIIKVSKGNRSDNKKYYQDVMKSMQEFRRQLNNTLDKLESSIKAKADKLKYEDEQKMKTIDDDSNTTLKNIEATTNSLIMLQSSKQECNLFVAMKKARAMMKSLSVSLDQKEQGNKISRYKFQPGIELQKLLKGKDVYGEILVMGDTDNKTKPSVTAASLRVQSSGDQSTVKGKSFPARQVVALNREEGSKGRPPVTPSMTAASPSSMQTNLQIRHVADINVNFKFEENNCEIKGVVALQDNKLIITDRSNNKVKVIDITSHQIVSEVKLSGKPWDITSISSKEFAVTLPYGQCIVFLILKENNTLDIGRKLSVNGYCRGIVYRKEQLVVLTTCPVRVNILSLNGEVKHTFDNDSTGRQLFKWPQYLAISPDKGTIYVSDFDKATVTSLSATGLVNAVYKDDQLKHPTGLATDNEGRVYVCCHGNNTIHVINTQCEKIKVLLTKDTGLKTPSALCYCKMTNKLFVGTDENTVKVYQMM